ncbi:MAG: hypothetical protein QW146_08360 [Candidatus Bathyarchaeia archaeon]
MNTKGTMLVVLAVILFHCVGCTSCTTSSIMEESKPDIYVHVSFFSPMGYKEELLGENVRLIFRNTTGLPMNPAVFAYEGFVEAKFEFMPFNESHCILYSLIYYNLSKPMTEDDCIRIANEFLSLFSYTKLKMARKYQATYDTVNVTSLRYEYISYGIEEVSEFLKYKPSNRFIDNFINRYVPGTKMINLMSISYTIKRNGTKLMWDFQIEGSTVLLLNGKTQAILDLNELLNNDKPIVASSVTMALYPESSKKKWFGLIETTYRMNIKDIYPNGYLKIQKTNFEEISYQYFPLDNVVITVEVKKITSLHPIVLGLIIIIIVGICIIAILIKHQRKQKYKT